MELINTKDLEWLAWNWRSWNNAKKYKTRRNMVYANFNQNLSFLPTPEQILSGLVLAQVSQFSSEEYSNVENFNNTVKMDVAIWKKIFSLAKNTDMKKPLTPSILSNPNHEFVKTIVYIYSLQSFVFKEMNKASREKDISKIELYGPLSSALSFVIHCGNQKKSDLSGQFIVYRGLKVAFKELD